MLAFLYCKVLCMYLPTWKWLLSQSGNLTTLYLITPRDFYPPTQHDGATSVCRCFLLLCKFNVLSNLWPFQVMQFSYWSSTHFLWTQTHKKCVIFKFQCGFIQLLCGAIEIAIVNVIIGPLSRIRYNYHYYYVCLGSDTISPHCHGLPTVPSTLITTIPQY